MILVESMDPSVMKLLEGTVSLQMMTDAMGSELILRKKNTGVTHTLFYIAKILRFPKGKHFN